MESVDIPIIYQDETLLVVDKPAGMHSVMQKDSRSPSVASWLTARFPALRNVSPKSEDSGLVQRLDRDTSGVLLVAKHSSYWAALRKILLAGHMDKRYLLLLEGRLDRRRSIESFLGSRYRHSKKVSSLQKRPAKGRGFLPAHTVFRARMYDSMLDVSFVEAEAHVARRHQVRVHAAVSGHPLVGDVMYGSRHALVEFVEGEELPSFFLHAHLLSFIDPWTSRSHELRAPLPNYILELWNRLKMGSK